MKFTTYQIQKGDTLESIAEKQGCTVKQLVQFHNQHAEMTQQIYGTHIPLHITEIYCPTKEQSNLQNKKNREDSTTGIKSRYRCEQSNVTIIDGKTVSSSIQKKQFLVDLDRDSKTAEIKIEDYYYNFNPPFLNEVFAFIKETELIRNNVVLNYDHDGTICGIVNKREQSILWELLKSSDKIESNFVSKLRQSDPVAFKNLIEAGDVQFSAAEQNVFEYQATPFYMILFDKYLTDDDFSAGALLHKKYRSNLFPMIDIPLQLRTTKVSDDDTEVKIRTVSEQNLDEEVLSLINEKYDSTYKQSIHYSFTQYKIVYRSRVLINKKDHTIMEAVLRIREAVVDNVESVFEYKIRKLENE